MRMISRIMAVNMSWLALAAVTFVMHMPMSRYSRS